MNPEIIKKILQYEPEPPASVWEGISKELDESLPGDIAEKLHNFQAAPPAGTWNKIEEKLLPAKPGKVRQGKFSTFARVASAAAIILIATASIIFWNRNDETTLATAGNKPFPLEPEKKSSPASSPTSVESINPESKESSAPIIAVNRNVAAQEKSTLSPKKNTSNKPYTNYQPSTAVAHSFIPEQAEEKAIAVSSYPIDKYMVYSDDDGNAMRLSKKLFELINCVKEELICRQQVQQMQNRIAGYMTTNDFTGVMEMLRNMKENK